MQNKRVRASQRTGLSGSWLARRRAFTLIEVLVVVVIIGVLSAFVTNAVVGSRDKARDAIRKANLREIASAIDNYYFDHGFAYPPDPAVNPGTEFTSESGDPDWILGLRPDYLKILPLDPRQASLIGGLAQATTLPQGQVAQASSETPFQAAWPPPYSSGTGNYTMGYRFQPNVNGQITKLWCYSGGTRNVRLYSDTGGAPLRSVNISCTGSWVSADIIPFDVTAGTFYRVALYTAGGTYYYKTSASPVTSGNIFIESGRYSTGDAFPTTSLANVFGLPDITFSTGAAASPTPAPSPSPSPSPSPTPTPSPSPSPSPTPTPSPAPSPSPSPVPSPTSSPAPSAPASPAPGGGYFYGYYVPLSRQSYVLWARLENNNDEQINTKLTASCQEPTPPGTSFNYCVKSP